MVWCTTDFAQHIQILIDLRVLAPSSTKAVRFSNCVKIKWFTICFGWNKINIMNFLNIYISRNVRCSYISIKKDILRAQGQCSFLIKKRKINVNERTSSIFFCRLQSRSNMFTLLKIPNHKDLNNEQIQNFCTWIWIWKLLNHIWNSTYCNFQSPNQKFVSKLQWHSKLSNNKFNILTKI